MNAHVIHRPSWSTATCAIGSAHTAAEVTLLGEHLDRCRRRRGRCFGLRCAVDAVHAFVAPRFLTTLVVASGVLALASLAVY